MRRKTIRSLAAVFALCAAALVCTQIEYDNEYDPKSPNYNPTLNPPPPTDCQLWGEWTVTAEASCETEGC